MSGRPPFPYTGLKALAACPSLSIPCCCQLHWSKWRWWWSEWTSLREGSHLFGKDKGGGMGKDATIDMSARHITHVHLNGRNPADNVHGHCHCPALCTVTDLQIPVCQHQLVQRKGIMKICNSSVTIASLARRALPAGQCLIVLLVQAEHWDRGVKDMRGHQCAKRQNIFLLVKDQAAGAVPFRASCNNTLLPA